MDGKLSWIIEDEQEIREWLDKNAEEWLKAFFPEKLEEDEPEHVKAGYGLQ